MGTNMNCLIKCSVYKILINSRLFLANYTVMFLKVIKNLNPFTHTDDISRPNTMDGRVHSDRGERVKYIAKHFKFRYVNIFQNISLLRNEPCCKH